MKHKINTVWAAAFVALFAIASPVAVAEKSAPIVVDPLAGIANTLNALVGKKVRIRLSSGAQVSGHLAVVGKQLIHLRELTGREYYDEVIVIGDVVGVEFRTK